MASKIMSFILVVLAVFSTTYAKPAAKPGIIAAAPAAIVPVGATYSAHVVNHAVTAPVVAAAPYVASPYFASPYSAYYGGYYGAGYLF